MAVQTFVRINGANEWKRSELLRLDPVQGALADFLHERRRGTDAGYFEHANGDGIARDQVTRFGRGQGYGSVRVQNGTFRGLTVRRQTGGRIDGKNQGGQSGGGI